jgi:hypothetical protein
VNYTLTGFIPDGRPSLYRSASAKASADLPASIPASRSVQALDVHTIGHSASQEIVGGPGSQKQTHACDGKGID